MSPGGRRSLAAVAIVLTSQLLASAWSSPARADTALVVDSVGDEPDAVPGDGACATSLGDCTLRAAIEEANASPGADVITFGLVDSGDPPATVFTISPSTPLPPLADPAGTMIDGYSQAGASANTDPVVFDGTLTVELRGTGPLGIDGISINGPNNTIRGLALYDFRRAFRIFGPNAANNVIGGNFIGTDASATFTAPEYVFGAVGINLQAGANSNMIGGLDPVHRNVIGGNAQHGVALYDFGTDANAIQNNLIGLAPSGDGPLPNLGHGVDVNTWASDNVIGGSAAGRNVVAATGLSGIEISHGSGTTGNTITHNYVGTNAAGTSAPAWASIGQFAINLEGLAQCSTVCEPDMSQSVVTDNVAVNALGGVMVHKAAFGNTVSDNLIGELPDGTPAGNSVFGVRVEKGAFDNLIGPGNVIAHNGNAIQLVTVGTNPPSFDSVDTSGNRFTANSIYANGGLGIDIEPLGAVTITPNAVANAGAPAPTITSASSATALVQSCAGCVVELFEADRPVGQFGPGRTFLASAEADASGLAAVRIPPSAAGVTLTATATTPPTELRAGSTSEFSTNVASPVPDPANTAPTAAFTVDCPRTECTFDANASSDADGVIEWYEWDFGDGATTATTSPTVTHEFGRAGDFDVTLTIVDNDAAQATAAQTATAINALPSAAFTATCDLQRCTFEPTGDDPDGEIISHLWDFGGLETSTEPVPVFTFPAGGSFTVTHTVEDNSEGSATTSASIDVNPFPSGLVAFDGFDRVETNGFGTAVAGGTWVPSVGPPADAATSDGRAVFTISQTAGLRTATLDRSAPVDVTVSAITAADKQPLGWGLTSHVAARSDGAGTEYRARVRRSGNGGVYLAIVRTVGGPAQTVLGSETFAPGLSAAPGTDLRVALEASGLEPTTLRAKVWAAGSPEPASWLVTVTDDTAELQRAGSIAIGAAPATSHTDMPVAFSFDELTATSPNELPVPTLTASCTNRTCQFDASGSADPDGSITFWRWDFGDGTVSTGTTLDTIEHTYTDLGPQTATIEVVDDQGGGAAFTETLELVNALPVAALSASCDGLACTFDASASSDPDGSVVSYDWDLGDTTTIVTTDPVVSHTYAASEVYSIVLQITDSDGGVDARTLTIEPSLPPVADISWSCAATTCLLDGSGSNDPDGAIATFEWDLGNGETATGPAVEVTYGSGEPVDVTLTVTDSAGISAATSVTVDPNSAPIAVADVLCDLLVCTFDASGSIDADGTIVSAIWDFGNGTTSTEFTGTVEYAEPGMFDVTLTVVDDEGASGVDTISISLTAAPVASFVSTCTGLDCTFDASASFDPDGTPLTFSWDFGDGEVATGPTPAHTFADGTARTVTVDATDADGTTGRATELVDPDAPPVAAFTSSCDQLACTFDASGSSDDDGITSYQWEFGDGSTATGVTASYTFATAGVYAITLTVTDISGTTALAGTALGVNQTPQAAITRSCVALECTFDGTDSSDPDGPLASWSWDFGDGATATGPSVTHTFADVGPHTVTLTVADDVGDTDAATDTFTLSATRQFAADGFERTVSDGWGNADVGGGWVPFGGSGEGFEFGVSGGQATVDVPGPGTGRSARLLGAFGSDTEVTTRFVTDQPSSGWGQYVSLIARRVSNNVEYRARVRISADGTFRIGAVKLTGTSTERIIGSEVAVPGLQHQPGTWYRMRTIVEGSNPTTLRIRVWADGAAEPGAWQLEVTDSEVALQNGGSVGVNFAVSASAVAVPVAFSIDDFEALIPLPTVPPTEIVHDTFERTIANGFGTADVGGVWQAVGNVTSVADGTARAVVPGAGTGRTARLTTAIATDVDASLQFRVDSPTSGWGQYLSLILRETGISGYRARVRIHTSGVYLGAVKTVDSYSEQLIGPEVLVEGVGITPGTWYSMRMQLDGTSPTTLRLKLWESGQPEPAAWTIDVTDDTPQLQGAGSVGINTAQSGSAVDAPIMFEIDDVLIVPLGQ